MSESELKFYIESASKAANAVGAPQMTFEAYSELVSSKCADEDERQVALARLASALGVQTDE